MFSGTSCVRSWLAGSLAVSGTAGGQPFEVLPLSELRLAANIVTLILAACEGLISCRFDNSCQNSQSCSTRIEASILLTMIAFRNGASFLTRSWGGPTVLSEPLHAMTRLMCFSGKTSWSCWMMTGSVRLVFPTLRNMGFVLSGMVSSFCCRDWFAGMSCSAVFPSMRRRFTVPFKTSKGVGGY